MESSGLTRRCSRLLRAQDRPFFDRSLSSALAATERQAVGLTRSIFQFSKPVFTPHFYNPTSFLAASLFFLEHSNSFLATSLSFIDSSNALPATSFSFLDGPNSFPVTSLSFIDGSNSFPTTSIFNRDCSTIDSDKTLSSAQRSSCSCALGYGLFLRDIPSSNASVVASAATIPLHMRLEMYRFRFK